MKIPTLRIAILDHGSILPTMLDNKWVNLFYHQLVPMLKNVPFEQLRDIGENGSSFVDIECKIDNGVEVFFVTAYTV